MQKNKSMVPKEGRNATTKTRLVSRNAALSVLQRLDLRLRGILVEPPMNTAVAQAYPKRGWIARRLTGLALALVWLVLAVLSFWAMAALYIDVRLSILKVPLTILYAVTLVVILAKYKLHVRSALLCFGCFCVVLVWWLNLKPTNTAAWQPNVDRPAWTEIDGDRLIIHNLRDCDYRTETDYSSCWSDRTVNLSDLRGVDLFFTTWGVRWIGHPILSFQFGNDQHVAFSIEARYKAGQGYSAILGFFRQYELIFVVADERDVIRLRTNFRKDEEVFLYRARLVPQSARAIFLSYVEYLNQLKDHPEWYNALTRNCTTAIDKQIASKVANPQPWNYQILVNGTLDELLFNRGRLVTDGLAFKDLKSRAHINAIAKGADGSPDFSTIIRTNRPGFENLK
jgi:Domain of unknown function (DUF4105)